MSTGTSTQQASGTRLPSAPPPGLPEGYDFSDDVEIPDGGRSGRFPHSVVGRYVFSSGRRLFWWVKGDASPRTLANLEADLLSESLSKDDTELPGAVVTIEFVGVPTDRFPNFNQEDRELVSVSLADAEVHSEPSDFWLSDGSIRVYVSIEFPAKLSYPSGMTGIEVVRRASGGPPEQAFLKNASGDEVAVADVFAHLEILHRDRLSAAEKFNLHADSIDAALAYCRQNPREMAIASRDDRLSEFEETVIQGYAQNSRVTSANHLAWPREWLRVQVRYAEQWIAFVDSQSIENGNVRAERKVIAHAPTREALLETPDVDLTQDHIRIRKMPKDALSRDW